MRISQQNPKHHDEEASLTRSPADTDLGDTSMEKYNADSKEKPAEESKNEVPLSRNSRFLIWTFLNVVSTVGIVSLFGLALPWRWH
jgi:solute carrier family 35 protein E3